MQHAHRFALISLAVAAISPVASAATFTVNWTADLVDLSPGNGVCLTTGGYCTLRAAVQEANALGGADTISIPAGTYVLTRYGVAMGAAKGDLNVTSNTTITGASGVIINGNPGGGNPADRIFDISGPPGGSITVTITDVEMHSGVAPNGGCVRALRAMVTLDGVDIHDCSTTTGDGAGIHTNLTTLDVTDSRVANNTAAGQGGGLYTTDSTVTISDSQVELNVATTQGGAAYIVHTSADIDGTSIVFNDASTDGGGLYAFESDLSLLDSIVSDNSAYDLGGGLAFVATGTNTLDITDSVFSTNDADNGAGAYIVDGDTTVARSTFDTNTASSNGGGLYLEADVASPTLLFENSAWYWNAADIDGGGLYVLDADVDIVNSTVAENLSLNDGGGLYSDGSAAIGLYSATVAFNAADYDADTVGDGGGLYSGGGSFTVRHLLLAENTGNGAPNCSATLTSGGYNMTEDPSGCTMAYDGTSQVPADTGVDHLGDFGGPTWSVALEPGAAAVDAGDGSSPYCSDSTSATLTTDQRDSANHARAEDGDGDTIALCDIGAYEYTSCGTPASAYGYLMAFHTCEVTSDQDADMDIDGVDLDLACDGPNNHEIRLSGTNDLVNFTELTAFTPTTGSVPDAYFDGEYLYIWTNYWRRYNSCLNEVDAYVGGDVHWYLSSAVELYTDYSLVEDGGTTYAFAAHSSSPGGPDHCTGAAVCTISIYSATATMGLNTEAPEEFTVDATGRADMTFQTGYMGAMTDPDVTWLSNNAEYLMLVSFGQNTVLYTSSTVDGSYAEPAGATVDANYGAYLFSSGLGGVPTAIEDGTDVSVYLTSVNATTQAEEVHHYVVPQTDLDVARTSLDSYDVIDYNVIDPGNAYRNISSPSIIEWPSGWSDRDDQD